MEQTAAKILLVEDNDFVRMQMSQFLQQGGHNVTECSDGRQALDTINKEFDVAIVDVRMEPMDGFEFIRAIRSEDLTIPVILATGDDNPDLLNEANKWDVAAVLMKPVEKDRLLKMIERTFKTRKKTG